MHYITGIGNECKLSFDYEFMQQIKTFCALSSLVILWHRAIMPSYVVARYILSMIFHTGLPLKLYTGNINYYNIL